MAQLTPNVTPHTFRQAKKHQECRAAIQVEFNALLEIPHLGIGAT